MAKAKTKPAASRKATKAPARPAKAPKKAAPAKSAKASAAKPAKPAAAKSAAAKPVAPKLVAKAAVEKASDKAVAAVTTRKTGPLTLPAATATAAPIAKPAPAARKPTADTAARADLPPSDGFTLLVDGHFKNCFDDLKGAKAAASELKGRFPMLKVEIYDAAKKARLPA